MMQFTVKLAFRVFEKTNANVPTQYKAVAFEHMDIVRKVMNALNYLRGAGHSPFLRRSFKRIQQSIDPKIYEITYSCSGQDINMGKQYVKITPDMELHKT